MDNTSNFPEQEKQPAAAEDDEEEEVASFRDFPLNSESPERERREPSKIQEKRRSSSEPSEFFEFFNDLSSEMSNAEDIIFCGKLVPYKNPPQIFKSLSADDATRFSTRYCHSLPELARARGPITAAARRKLPRHGRSVDCRSRRLMVQSETSDIHRSSSKSSAKSEGSKVLPKPRWFVMMFGPLKLQPEMDLRDMKNRQVRRNTGRIFPGGGAPHARSDRRSFWGLDLLKVLSCKNHASVAVKSHGYDLRDNFIC